MIVYIVGIVVFLILNIAFYDCLHCWDSRVPNVYHGVLWLFTVSLLDSRVPYVYHGVLWLFTMSLLDSRVLMLTMAFIVVHDVVVGIVVS